jgi:hypothetical protein
MQLTVLADFIHILFAWSSSQVRAPLLTSHSLLAEMDDAGFSKPSLMIAGEALPGVVAFAVEVCCWVLLHVGGVPGLWIFRLRDINVVALHFGGINIGMERQRRGEKEDVDMFVIETMMNIIPCCD